MTSFYFRLIKNRGQQANETCSKQDSLPQTRTIAQTNLSVASGEEVHYTVTSTRSVCVLVFEGDTVKDILSGKSARVLMKRA